MSSHPPRLTWHILALSLSLTTTACTPGSELDTSFALPNITEATELCGLFPTSCSAHDFDFQDFCDRRPQLDHNCCHMLACSIPETTPGGLCDPNGNGMGDKADLPLGIWQSGHGCFSTWEKEKC